MRSSFPDGVSEAGARRPTTATTTLSAEGRPQPVGPFGAAVSGWTLLGYDVADAGRISGLTNCGYTPEEREGCARSGRRVLDGRHLFGDEDAAFAFAELSERARAGARAVPVYCLYGVG